MSVAVRLVPYERREGREPLWLQGRYRPDWTIASTLAVRQRMTTTRGVCPAISNATAPTGSARYSRSKV